MNRTHRVQFYSPPTSDADPFDSSGPGWTASGYPVEANLQPLTGSVEQTAAGREIGADWRGFVPAGTSVQQDDGLAVLEGVGPARYRVVQVGEQGAPWDTELVLRATAEEFGG